MNEILFKSYFKTMRHASSKNEKKIHRSGSRSWIGSSNKATESEKTEKESSLMLDLVLAEMCLRKNISFNDYEVLRNDKTKIPESWMPQMVSTLATEKRFE